MKKSIALSSVRIPTRLLRWGVVGLLAWLAVTVVSAGVQGLRIPSKADAAIRDYQRIVAEAAKPAQDSQEKIRKLTQNNLFVPPPQKAKPPACQAILGDAALFNDKWHKVGDTVGGAKITAIGPSSVSILFDEKEMALVPFEAEARPDASGGRPQTSRPSDAAASSGSRSGPPRGRDGGEMRRRFESMSPEERQQMMQRFQNATPEEREQMRQQMRDQFRQSREQ